jgi:hypothetical protein
MTVEEAQAILNAAWRNLLGSPALIVTFPAFQVRYHDDDLHGRIKIDAVDPPDILKDAT